MKFTVKRIAENLLFAADIFIIFLVCFESKMVFPAWLQSAGRMHPMFLHFPIVILLLAMGMEFFRFRSEFASQPFYQHFTTGLLLTGALSAAVTVIMGLLLSKENGYDGDTVAWHKWMGILIVAIASFVYWYRNAESYKAPVAKLSAVVIAICLVIAGDLGAAITHGDDFVTAPIIAKRAVVKVPADKAIVFADVIQPVLKAKCMSCHNSGKSKGGLLLDNAEDLLKGGKTGKLFIAAHADSSLMIERILLPEEDKKHMPLSGKPQLTKDETELLYRWIQSGADFKKKFSDLPGDDSLRLVAAKFLAPASEEEYTFSAADEKKVKELSNNYRVIVPLAKESPALVVDFYNKRVYNSKALQDLTALKKQIVALNLNKMPVKDEDIKIIGQFENLRTLNLDFTDITGEGLNQLSALKHLKSLSVSGNKLSYKNTLPLTAIKSLKQVFIWNTGLKPEDIDQLQKANYDIRYVEGYKNNGPPMPLNDPILLTTRTVFTDTIHLFMKHPIPGVQIRYTLDGSHPDSSQSPVFTNDLVLDKTCIFKARAFKTTWLGSDSIMVHFYKSVYKPDSIVLVTTPNESYKGAGPKTLVDHITGDMGFGSGKWMGFQKDMELMLQFKTAVKMSSVGMHLLKNIGADIYPPTRVEVWGGNDQAHLKLFKTILPVAPVKGDTASIFLLQCDFPATNIKYIKLVALNVKKAPKWGNSPGKPGWIFMDELLLN